MSQRWSEIYCATSALGGKPVGRVRIKKKNISASLIRYLQQKMAWKQGIPSVLKYMQLARFSDLATDSL